MLTCSPILKCYPSPLYKLWLRSTLNLQTISMLLRNKEKLKATKAKSRQIKRKQKIVQILPILKQLPLQLKAELPQFKRIATNLSINHKNKKSNRLKGRWQRKGKKRRESQQQNRLQQLKWVSLLACNQQRHRKRISLWWPILTHFKQLHLPLKFSNRSLQSKKQWALRR